MPWKETDVVNLRNEFVMRAFEDKIPFIALCQEYGISPKTGYKWKERFLSKGICGLSDQSRKPHSSPTQTTEDQACRLIRLKLAHSRWGTKKSRDLFSRHHCESVTPSVSTVIDFDLPSLKLFEQVVFESFFSSIFLHPAKKIRIRKYNIKYLFI